MFGGARLGCSSDPRVPLDQRVDQLHLIVCFPAFCVMLCIACYLISLFIMIAPVIVLHSQLCRWTVHHVHTLGIMVTQPHLDVCSRGVRCGGILQQRSVIREQCSELWMSVCRRVEWCGCGIVFGKWG